MIENHDMGGFVLTCDICEEESGEGFDEYSDVVDLKKTCRIIGQVIRMNLGII